MAREHAAKFPWICCSVCAVSSEKCSSLYITKPCAHFVCGSCRQRRQPRDGCPACRKTPVAFEAADLDTLGPFLDDDLDSAAHLQKTLGLQKKHYLQSCAREREVLAGRSLQDIPLAKLEKETLQFECKIKQMRKWKSANAALWTSRASVLKHLVETYNNMQCQSLTYSL